MFQKNLLAFCFVFAGSFLVAGQHVIDRPGTTSVTKGSKISDIPYGYYINSLSPQMIKAIDQLDLSQKSDMRVFVGYGTYDKEDLKCKYLDTGITQHAFDLKFHKLKKHSGHSYAISRDKKTLTQCNALAAQFHAYLMVPSTPSENQGVLGRGQPLYDEEGWLGVHRQNCSTPYKGVLDNDMSYTNFYESIDDCDPGRLFVYKKAGTSLWSRGTGNELKNCIVEFESEDVTRPVKVCAPWWRIERTYKLPPQDQIMINGVQLDLYNINQATLPMRMTTCLKYATENNNTETSDRQEICKSYYDITQSPVCKGDLIQSECFVDECNGYIKNVCSKNDIQPSADGKVKDYVWGYVMENGSPVKVKIKDKIRSHAYTCPPSAASMSKCKLTGDVVVFPYQCNPSVCTEFKKCIGNKNKSRAECHTLHPCEEVYGDSTSPVIENGSLVGFRAKCGNQRVVNRNINKISKTTEKCLKYKDIVDVISEQKKCTVTAKERKYEVDAAITEQDIYSERDDCVRMNDIDTARPKINLTFDYKNNGFYNLALVKSTHDGDVSTTDSKALNPIAHDLQYMQLTTESQTGGLPQHGIPKECLDAFQSDWLDKRVKPFATSANTWSGLMGILKRKPHADSASSKPIIAVLRRSDENLAVDVSGVANELGFPSTQLNGYENFYHDYDFASLGVSQDDLKFKRVVIIGGNSTIKGDQLPLWLGVNSTTSSSLSLANSYVSGDSGDVLVRGEDCETFAKCAGFFVTTQYADKDEEKVCQFSNNPALDNTAPPSVSLQDVHYPDYNTSRDVIATSIDGTTDIFSVQEFADGAFGYVSNYHFLLPKNNEVYLDGKEIFPIVRQNPIGMHLDYKYKVKQYTQRVKNEDPDIQQGSYEGSTVGVNPNYVGAVGAGVGVGAAAFALGYSSFAGPAGLVVAAVVLYFASDVKYGDLSTNWSISEPAPERYVPNVYGYDFREKKDGEFIYTREKFLSPTLEDDDFEKLLSDHAAHKTVLLYNQGYSKSLVDNTLLRPCETSVCGGYPGKGHWWNPWWHKTKTKTEGPTTTTIIKRINSLYLGATDTVSIFVPYAGDYLVTAYSKTGNVIGETLVKLNDFVPASANIMSYAPIDFAKSSLFMLAPGIVDGSFDNACRYDSAVEWGGGVSGIYYEQHTPQGNVCAKSNDHYVSTNYADYITIRQIKSNKAFKIKMIRPMPYPNRFFLTTYGKLEKRKYTCYEKGKKCKP